MMSISDLGNIGELIGSVGVLVSLIYLAVQIRRNTDMARTSTYQSVVSDFGTLTNTVAASPELAELLVRGQEDFASLTAGEKARISQLFFGCFHYFENMYYQHKNGYLDDDVWMGWKRLMLTYYQRPGYRAWWQFRRSVFSDSFATFIESEQPDIAVASYYDVTRSSG